MIRAEQAKEYLNIKQSLFDECLSSNIIGLNYVMGAIFTASLVEQRHNIELHPDIVSKKLSDVLGELGYKIKKLKHKNRVRISW